MGTADRPLDASALRDWAHAVVSDLILHIDEINRLNVFPVADSDTGVNMLFTMRAAVVEADLHANSHRPNPSIPSAPVSFWCRCPVTPAGTPR